MPGGRGSVESAKGVREHERHGQATYERDQGMAPSAGLEVSNPAQEQGREGEDLGVCLGLDESRYPVILLMSFVRARPESGVVEVVGNETWLNGPYAEVVAGVASYSA